MPAAYQLRGVTVMGERELIPELCPSEEACAQAAFDFALLKLLHAVNRTTERLPLDVLKAANVANDNLKSLSDARKRA